MSKLDKLCSLIPIHEIEQAAMQQIYKVLELECLEKLAIMPDVHAGYDLPIGGVALDEAPGAYKNYDYVIDAQNGIVVDILDRFKPIIVVKG